MFNGMDGASVTRREIACAIRKSPWLVGVVTMVASMASVSCSGSTPAQPGTTPAPAAPLGPPKPLEGATISITSTGFVLDAASAAFRLADLHVYQGSRLTFVNTDNTPHDVLSDPPHVHTDCPEINAAGYLVPGQSRSTDPLNRILACGFHDHTHEGESAFAGKVTVEPR
jgi:plastocyanin